jgi:glyoxylase-like metal-dependent hydrolase (beta-lactamase superfamily II)
VRPIGGGWAVPVPIPDNPLQYTLVYVLESDRGPVLVDTGWDAPDCYGILADGIAATGAAVSDVHGVLVTHYHPDHHGLSGRVRAESGAWIGMHAAEAQVVRAMREIPEREWGRRMLENLLHSGIPEDYADALRGLRGRPGRTRSETEDFDAVRSAQEEAPDLVNVLPDRDLVHTEQAGVPGRDVRVVWTPGHTPGHVCLHLRDGDRTRLLTGDHLLPTISPQISLYPDDAGEDTDPLGDFLDSLERIGALAPDEVLPAHQYRFTGGPERVRELLEHHSHRLAELHAALRARPLTQWACAQAMTWNRPWSELSFFSRHMALSEAAAHLRRLVKTGLAEQVPDTDPYLFRGL